MPAPTSSSDEIAERRERQARKCGLRLAYEMTRDRHGADFLGRTQPRNRHARDAERAAARAAWSHLAENQLIGIFPEWLTEDDAPIRAVDRAVA